MKAIISRETLFTAVAGHSRGVLRFALVLFAGIFFLAGCSDLKNNSLPTPPALTVHPPEWSDAASPGFHGVVLGAEHYDWATCGRCHAKNFEGGTSGVSCEASGCHVSANGTQKSPESCNTCHGSFRAEASDTLSWAPPRAVNGDTITTSRGVGAHQVHVNADASGQRVECKECHTVPTEVFQAGHLDASASAKVVFNGTRAVTVTANGTLVPHPSYDPAALQCSNTFCHGNWKALKSSAPTINQQFYSDSVMVGNNDSPQWTGGASQAACGTCHGLPPQGHVPLAGNLAGAKCSDCHQGVVDANNNILNTGLHMNGKIDVFSTERSF
ncbi:MAG: hypothetical protein KGJ59_08830 [Bacteroidota bacterium]|nr:hypothetical protein [Bacteroidota bacterium]